MEIIHNQKAVESKSRNLISLMILNLQASYSFNSCCHVYAQLQKLQISVTTCKISFLLVFSSFLQECLIIQCQFCLGRLARQAACSSSRGHLLIQLVRVGEEVVWRVGAYFCNKMVTICATFICNCVMHQLPFILYSQHLPFLYQTGQACSSQR